MNEACPKNTVIYGLRGEKKLVTIRWSAAVHRG